MQPDIQYVCYRYEGTAALQPQVVNAPVKVQNNAHPAIRRKKRKVLRINMVPVLAVLLTAVMLVCITVSMVRVKGMQAQEELLQQYIVSMEEENVTLQEQYRQGYDLEDIRQKALAMGMVPAEQVEQITIQVQIPQDAQEQTVWDRIGIFLAGLFA